MQLESRPGVRHVCSFIWGATKKGLSVAGPRNKSSGGSDCTWRAQPGRVDQSPKGFCKRKCVESELTLPGLQWKSEGSGSGKVAIV